MRMLRTQKRQQPPKAVETKYALLVTELAGQRDFVVAARVVDLESRQPECKGTAGYACTHCPNAFLGEGLDELGRGVAGLRKLRLLVLQLLLELRRKRNVSCT